MTTHTRAFDLVGRGHRGLSLLFGRDTVLTQMAWFFTKAALLTFGGAYAVLPYVYQGAVEHFQWLMPAQMIAGLALGETTPGPLIMVVSYVGYVGAGRRRSSARRPCRWRAPWRPAWSRSSSS